MKQILISFIVLVFLFVQSGCTEKVRTKQLPPEDLIPRETMVDVIVDMHLFDAIIWKEQKKRVKEIQYHKNHLFKSILEKHNITANQFENSLNYYQSDMEGFDEIYADVITKLSKTKSETEKE